VPDVYDRVIGFAWLLGNCRLTILWLVGGGGWACRDGIYVGGEGDVDTYASSTVVWCGVVL
jgi:hypothetical protein